MKNFFAIFALILLGISPLSAQQTIFLRHDDPIRGTVLWDRTTTDRLFFQSTDNSGDTLVQFVPRREVEYIVDCDSSKYVYKGVRKGWQPWRGKGFHEEPRQQMLYGVSGSWILDGWSADASFMRVLNRNSRIAVGGFVRYMFTQPVPLPVKTSYDHHAIVFGPQAEFRGYSRRLKSYFYLDFGLGATYHRFDWGNMAYSDEAIEAIDRQGSFTTEYLNWIRDHYPTDRWTYAFNYKVGVYVRLTRGLYADVGFVGVGHIFSRIPQKYNSSDQYPFGLSVGLRFGRESR